LVTSTATIMSLAASFDESVSCIPWCHFIQSKHSSWETSDVTDMSHLFHVATSSTQDISHWNTCSATAMWLICFIWSMVALPSMSAVSCGCIRCIKNVSRVPKLDFSNLRQFHPWIHPTWQVGDEAFCDGTPDMNERTVLRSLNFFWQVLSPRRIRQHLYIRMLMVCKTIARLSVIIPKLSLKLVSGRTQRWPHSFVCTEIFPSSGTYQTVRYNTDVDEMAAADFPTEKRKVESSLE
jgi:hypothetical protein